MSNATVTTIQELGGRHTAATCTCAFRETEIHDQLLGLELMTATEAVALTATLAMAEMVEGFDAGDFTRFVAAHNWFDPAKMTSLAMQLDDLSAAYCKDHDC
jgi:hypothetical protein